ncbi:MAG: SRPBCC family protein [Dehalococcoidia bacterium]|nr:SRPBCC family protein [Dehalococcoidia bacterium]
MPKVELQRVYHVPLDKALEYFGNHDVYSSQHARSDTTCTTVSRKDNEFLVDVKQQLGGQTINFTTKTVYRLPKSIETETLSGMAKGSRQKVAFESVPEGTKVTYVVDFKMQLGGAVGKALGLVSGKMMKKMTRETMEEAAEVDRKYLEGEQTLPPTPA